MRQGCVWSGARSAPIESWHGSASRCHEYTPIGTALDEMADGVGSLGQELADAVQTEYGVRIREGPLEQPRHLTQPRVSGLGNALNARRLRQELTVAGIASRTHSANARTPSAMSLLSIQPKLRRR